MIPQPPQRPAIPVGKLKEVLAQVPDDHGLVPSQIYDFFIVDKKGHNKGYISTSGELYWWPVEENGESIANRLHRFRSGVTNGP